MTYRIQIHAIDQAQTLAGLDKLPSTIEWRLFRSAGRDWLFLDHGFDQNSEWDSEQFSKAPNFHDGPLWRAGSLNFDRDHSYLNEVAKQFPFGEMNRPMIKYALLVSALIKGRVFFSYADDQCHEAVCIALSGRVQNLKFCAGDELVSVDAAGGVVSTPNPYASDDGWITGGLTLHESVRHLGYRLSCLEDVALDDPPREESDEYELMSQSELGKRRQSTWLEVARDLFGFLFLGRREL